MTFIAAILLTTVAAMAQHEEGDFTVMPKVGLNIATLSDDDKAITDLHFGIEAEYMVTDNFSLGLGAILSNQGAKYDFWDEYNGQNKYTVDLDYVHVPILASYYVLPGLAVKAGIQPGFNVLKKINLDGTLYQGGVQGGNPRSINESYKLDKNDGVKSFQFAIPVGLSYEYKNFVLDARYNIALTKAFKDSDPRHSVFSVTLGYKIPLN
jgi:long-subunit fatty acid transport protein